MRFRATKILLARGALKRTAGSLGRVTIRLWARCVPLSAPGCCLRGGKTLIEARIPGTRRQAWATACCGAKCIHLNALFSAVHLAPAYCRQHPTKALTGLSVEPRCEPLACLRPSPLCQLLSQISRWRVSQARRKRRPRPRFAQLARGARWLSTANCTSSPRLCQLGSPYS